MVVLGDFDVRSVPSSVVDPVAEVTSVEAEPLGVDRSV